jgi:hydroxymethylbilane synthase
VTATSKPIVIATRGSALALAQAGMILAQCRATVPDQSFELRIIKTTGDKLQTASMANADLPKGLFTKEIEEALLRNEADLAVHSLKDLPTALPDGLKLGAVSRRADVRDVLVYREIEWAFGHIDHTRPIQQNRRAYRSLLTLQALPHGATVATSSTRRAAQALDARPDLKIVPIRGNVGTRLRKIAEQSELDATVLAAAGLDRLGFRISAAGRLDGDDVPPGLGATRLAIDEMLPCVGQAAIGVEIRQNDPRLDALCAVLNDSETFAAVTAERTFLEGMGGGCLLAVAAYGEILGQELRLRGVSYLHGKPRRGESRRSIAEAATLGRELASELGGPK